MADSKRLTPDREHIIREWANKGTVTSTRQDYLELLAEIDALRFELDDSELDFDDVGKYAVEFATATKAAQNERDALKAENEKLKNLRDRYRSTTLDGIDAMKESVDAYKENQKLRSRVAKLRGVLEDWLACTPSEASGKYSEITQWNACRALEVLAQDDSCIDSIPKPIHPKKDVSDEESGK